MKESDAVNTRDRLKAALQEGKQVLKQNGLAKPVGPSMDAKLIIEEWDQLKFDYQSINRIPFHLLGEFLLKWSSLTSNTRFLESVYEVEFLAHQKIFDANRKQIFNGMEVKGREAKEAAATETEIYISNLENLIRAQSRFELVKGIRFSYEIITNAISREITRRNSDQESNARGGSRGGV